jgi:hypothetical protein
MTRVFLCQNNILVVSSMKSLFFLHRCSGRIVLNGMYETITIRDDVVGGRHYTLGNRSNIVRKFIVYNLGLGIDFS